jgi:phage/plasmid-like protein (TIGR03299 family)
MENDVFDDYPGREVAYIAAGHDFIATPFENGDVLAPLTKEEFDAVKGNRDIPIVRHKGQWCRFGHNSKKVGYRIDHTRADGTIGALHGKSIEVLNRTFEPIQNNVPWDMLDAILSDPVINRSTKINYETGGVLEDGASCYVTAWIDRPFQVEGDNSPVYPYIFATWRHDGAGALNFGDTSIRIVCANTRGFAENEAGQRNRMFSFKHTKNVHERIEDVKMMLKGILANHDEFDALAHELAAIEVTPEQRREFVAKFIPMPESTGTVEGDASKRQVANVERERGKVLATFNSRSIPEAHAYTGWGLYNAATEYLDHLRPTKGGADITEAKYAESYVKRQVTPNRAKAVVPALIREVVAA